jgi:pimeloyl-ACP methyl ester carboxylesterase
LPSETSLAVPTQSVETKGIRFAYRRWGKPSDVPLVFLNYFSGNLDDWDPKVSDGLAAEYEVILFDNAGVASSAGQTPGTVAEMTGDALTFCDALGLKKFNIVGFSLGGMIAQQMALDRPDRVNRILLLGTGPRGGEGMTFTELSTDEQADPEQFLLGAFFSPSDASQAAGPRVPEAPSRTDHRPRPARFRENGRGTVERNPRMGSGALARSLCPFAEDQTADSDCAWHQGHRGPADQRLHPRAAPAERAARHVSRFQPRRPISTC